MDRPPAQPRPSKFRRRLTYLLPLPLFFAPFLILLGPDHIKPGVASFLFFPGVFVMFAFRSVIAGLIFSGLFYYLSAAALLAIVLRPRTHLTPWWHIGKAAWAFIGLGLIAVFIAQCHANWNPD